MESSCSPCGALPRRSARLERQDQTAIPFHHLSMSNLPPTDRELSDIQTTILPALDQDILDVDSDAAVTTARLALASFEQERDALKDIKQNYENIISTRRRIPPEIWSEIFLYGHFLESLDRSEVFHWPSRTIWQLSQVCQTWRNLAFSLHSCWSSIVLKFPLLRSASERDVELLAFVLERSHQHLLDITFIRNSVEDLPFLRRMREKVFAESYRWRTACLIDRHVLKSSDLLYAPLRGRMPQLELLDLRHVRGLDSDNTVISAFKDCPRLVTVVLTGVDPRMVELPVKQITCLCLDDQLRADYFRAYVDLVSQCPLLESLHVDVNEGTPDPLLQSLTLPYLRALKATYPNLLDSLTLPRLEVAALDGSFSFPHPDTLCSFYCLIRRSNCASNLTELQIIRMPLTPHRSEPHLLLSILSQTTELATLQLWASVLDSEQYLPDEWSRTQIIEVIKALKVVPGHRVAFLPRLVSLDIEVTGDTDMDHIPSYLQPHNDFAAMLKARHAGNEVGLSTLEKFHFGLRSDFDMARRPENKVPSIQEGIFNDYETSVLRGLAEDGMSLNIHFEGVLG
ncbi:hypothetical protein BDZ89DRAFT_1162263 [Hymenopellis radicata]|nr:hypothetical protein BDZ89DRAFT_1162263 [Hymenopellis radicata]